MTQKSDFINEIKQRGFVYQATDIDELEKIMSKKSVAGYIGFDITNDSLHIGSLVQLMLLHWLDYYEHKAIALVVSTSSFIETNSLAICAVLIFGPKEIVGIFE